MNTEATARCNTITQANLHAAASAQVPFRWATRIRYIDVDASGRIHNTALIRYFESTETEFLRHLGMNLTTPEEFYPRVRLECEFRGAMRFDDLVTFELRIGELRQVSVRYDFAALKDGTMTARGSVTVVCMNAATERPQPFPDRLANGFRNFAEARPEAFTQLNAPEVLTQ